MVTAEDRILQAGQPAAVVVWVGECIFGVCSERWDWSVGLSENLSGFYIEMRTRRCRKYI